MKKLLLALVPWMAMAAAAQDIHPASVVYTHKGRFEKGFERVGQDCLATPDALEKLGWKVTVGRNDATIEAEGRLLRVPVSPDSAGHKAIPLGNCLYQLGASGQWIPGSDDFIITGNVRNLEIKKNGFRFTTTMATKPKIKRSSKPDRLIFDFEGASLGDQTKLDLPDGVRIGQLSRTIVRVVVEKPGVDNVDLPPMESSRSFDVELESIVLLKPEQPKPVDPPPVVVKQTQEEPDPATQPGPSYVQPTGLIQVGRPQTSRSATGDLQIDFPISARLKQQPSANYLSPMTIEVTVPSAQAPSANDIRIVAELVSELKVTNDIAGVVKITLTTTQPVGYKVSADGKMLSLALVKPRVADGSMRGKVIVVDAGHGGTDSGATASSAKEKNLTLKIARNVGEELSGLGVAVIMTRTDDIKVPLTERADIANRSNADLFVSIHINSNDVGNSSGVIIFYHGGSSVSKLLAQTIASQVAKVSGLPDWGAMSDKKIYQSGFSVLRNTKMPGVLCELGFISNSKDRARMLTEDFQVSVAKAIVQGIKVFIGDVKPSKENP
ncbi:MAG: N-acetylmuramoyl-L-alanine amidase [Armatimonadetes bacterium]|nr:N-acetylmuramoyl-L-alanine amidase [Armatimonadota bacterium]